MINNKIAILSLLAATTFSLLSISFFNKNDQTQPEQSASIKTTNQSNLSSSQPELIKKITVSHQIIQLLLSYDKVSLLKAAVEADPQLTASFDQLTKLCPVQKVESCLKLFLNILPENHPEEMKGLLVNLYRLYIADKLLSTDKQPLNPPLIANNLQEILGESLTQALTNPDTSTELSSLFQRLETEPENSEQYQHDLTELETLLNGSLSKQEALSAELKLLELTATDDEQKIVEQAKAIQSKYYANSTTDQLSPFTKKQNKQYQEEELVLLEEIDRQYPDLNEIEKQRIISNKLAELRARVYYPNTANSQ